MEYSLKVKRIVVERQYGNRLVVHLEGGKAGDQAKLEALLRGLDDSPHATAELILRFTEPWPKFSAGDEFLVTVAEMAQ